MIINATNTFCLILTSSKLQGKTSGCFSKIPGNPSFNRIWGIILVALSSSSSMCKVPKHSPGLTLFPVLTFFELDSLPHYFPAPADSRCSKGGPGWHFHLHSCSIRGRGLFLVLVTVGLQSRAGMVAPRRTSRIQLVPSVLLLGHLHGASWTSCSKMAPHVIYFLSSRMEEGDRKGLPPLVKGITWELLRSLLLIIAH